VPNQDVEVATLAQPLTITFNEPMAATNLNLIRLQVLGFKGGEVPLDADFFADVPITTQLSPEQRTLIIDIAPAQHTPFAPGRVFAVTGFEGLFGRNGSPFDALNPNNFLPAVQLSQTTPPVRFLRFTTHAGAARLALAAAPVQVPNTAQNSSVFFFPALLDIDFSTQAPSGARAFRVFASPGGSTTDPTLFCQVFASSVADHPPTVLSIPLEAIGFALSGCHRPLPNTQWDDGLTIDVAVAVVDADGQTGPLSAILTAKDNVQPGIENSFPVSFPPWLTGSPAGTFQIQIVFTEEMAKSPLTNLANYTIRAVGAGRYTVSAVTIPSTQNQDPAEPFIITLTFTLTGGFVRDGDAITLSQALTDEVGNPLDPGANTLRVSESTIIIGGTP
jgi:hypothetical protein